MTSLASAVSTAATISATEPDDAAVNRVGLCDSCDHRLDGHDSIGLRYCRATLANGADRGCICGE